MELEERHKNVVNDVYQEDREELFKIFGAACKDRFRGGEGELRYLKGDGSIMWMHLRAFFL